MVHLRLTCGQLILLVLCVLCVRGHRHTVTPADLDSTSSDPLDNTLNDADPSDQWAADARKNVLQMGSDSIRCATPRPRVLKVQDFHPHAHKRFMPSCVVLHRCDRHSGCCDNEDNACAPIKKRKVFLHFFVVALSEEDGVASVSHQGEVERLRFTNHTKCGCRKRKPRDKTPPIGQSVSSEGTPSVWLVPLWLPLAPVLGAWLSRAWAN